jgi:hypothetical protein
MDEQLGFEISVPTVKPQSTLEKLAALPPREPAPSYETAPTTLPLDPDPQGPYHFFGDENPRLPRYLDYEIREEFASGQQVTVDRRCERQAMYALQQLQLLAAPLRSIRRTLRRALRDRDFTITHRDQDYQARAVCAGLDNILIGVQSKQHHPFTHMDLATGFENARWDLTPPDAELYHSMHTIAAEADSLYDMHMQGQPAQRDFTDYEAWSESIDDCYNPNL